MKSLSSLFTIGLVLFISCSQPQEDGDLIKGQIKEGSFSIYEVHEYNVTLEEGQFVTFVVEQKGIDLVIDLKDPFGDIVQTFDSPNGRFGPEYIQFTTEVDGPYQLRVMPLGKDDVEGDYTATFVSSITAAQSNEGKVDQLFARWNRDDSPGAAVAVVRDGEIIYSNGYGMANLEYDIPIIPSTVFHIASVSKQFTGFAVMLLENDGKLSYDDDIRKYIPELNDFGKTITLSHLVHHTSGLRDQWNLLALGGWRLDDVITTDHVMKLMSRQEELNFTPGEEYLYCNSGFTLLAEVVARVSGMTFAEFCEKRIFEPLEMESTLFYDDHEQIVKNRAYSYGSNEGERVKRVLSYANVGATSLFTTVEDLSKWAINFEDPTVGTPEMMEKMLEGFVLNNGDTSDYAYGQGVWTYRGLNARGHGGADAGYRTNIQRFPDQKFSVIVFSNEETFNPGSLCRQIVDIYLEDEFVEEEEEVEEDTEEESEDGFVVETELLEKYAGDYELQPGFILTFRIEDDGRFTAQATGQGKIDLQALTNNEFEAASVNAKVIFNVDEEGEIVDALLIQGDEFPLKRMAPFDPTSVDLAQFEGLYYSKELDTDYELQVKNDTLFAVHQRHPDIQLTPVSENAFGGNRWFFGSTKMIADDAGTITGMLVSSGRVRDLKFEKVK